MSERAKLGILCVLLLLATGFTIVKVVDTFGAMRNLQRQYSDARSGDVSTVRPWMTTHAISLIYRVPEDYVNSSLDITSTPVHHHETLYEIASHKRQPVDRVIHTVQRAILTYRKGHRRISMPTRTHLAARKPFSPGRTVR
ncbi:MAG: hypothetical protein E6I79_02265 [Chloroflexi bacterium]|nr:MAG: hypothetical protein E6I79_02265 [Chloroflexota bacterium]